MVLRFQRRRRLAGLGDRVCRCLRRRHRLGGLGRGIALGWIPALAAAYSAFMLFRYLWWTIAVVAVILVLAVHGM